MKSISIRTDLCMDNESANAFYRRDAATQSCIPCASASLRLLYSLLQTQRVAARPIQDLDLKGYLGCTGFASCEMRGNDSFLMEPQKVETTADGSK